MFMPYNRVLKFLKQKLIELKGTDSHFHKYKVRDFNTPLLIVNRISRQKISKDTGDLNNLNSVIYRKLPNNRIHIIFNSMENIYQNEPYSENKTSLNKFFKIRIIQSIFYNHKLEINNRKPGKSTNT